MPRLSKAEIEQARARVVNSILWFHRFVLKATARNPADAERLDAAMRAVNVGEIYRFFLKPWAEG